MTDEQCRNDKAMKVLLVEDDTETAGFILEGLTEFGAAVSHETSAKAGLLTATTQDFDVIIFDRLLPGMDGLDAVKVMRKAEIRTPILMLTALGGIDDRVAGLDAGADDYMVKPFAFSELHARIKALLRRQPMVEQQLSFQIADLTLDRTTQRVSRGAELLDLSPREYKILEYLMRNEGHLVTKTMLLENVWGYRFNPKTSLVQTHVSRLRAKVDKPFEKELIQTVRGSGYVISA